MDFHSVLQKLFKQDKGFASVSSAQFNQLKGFPGKNIHDGLLMSMQYFKLANGGVVIFQFHDFLEDFASPIIENQP